MLDTQFRMHPMIATYISDNFYESKYRSGVGSEARTLEIGPFTKPICFIDTKNSKQKHEDENEDAGTGFSNHFEATICADYLSTVIEAIETGNYGKNPKDLKLEDIGVITAYKKQIGEIRERVRKSLCRHYPEEEARELADKLSINTLDSFQGRDNQIIFYSFVRSNDGHSIGFLNEVRRLNVMMTRAKSLLVMVGDSETLEGSYARTLHDGKRAKEYFGKLVAYCKENGGYMDIAQVGE